jgi:hypothetical protein
MIGTSNATSQFVEMFLGHKKSGFNLEFHYLVVAIKMTTRHQV